MIHERYEEEKESFKEKETEKDNKHEKKKHHANDEDEDVLNEIDSFLIDDGDVW